MTITVAPHTGRRRERIAVFGLFGLYGIVIATWAVHIPTVQARTGISNAMLGSMLLVLGLGAIGGMQCAAPLTERLGSGRVAVAAASIMSAALVVPLLATSVVSLVAGLLILGAAMGVLDVSMNARAVVVERRYERPIMSAFHAVFSVGSVAGSLIGVVLLALSWTMPATVVAVEMLCAVLVGGVARTLARSRTTTDRATPGPRPGGGSNMRRDTASPAVRPHRRVVMLGLLAFLLLLSEGVAMDWSSVHAQDYFGVSESVGGLAFAAFVAAMTIGRFTADAVANKQGPVWVLRTGCVIAFAGMALVFLSSALPLTMLGWAVFGIGLSGCIPQVFTAAGNLPGASAADLSRVVGLGYVAMLAGPAAIGWLTSVTALHATLILPLCAVVICAAAASSVRRNGTQSESSTL
ncbi:MFS transporter [Rhodococcus sp. MSC1_016]|uniref:MFS transporter n=1 Tax=Rhodococcus sp. MSC1_016 TaxID=2909266 RepID=UPI00202FABA7|nr:MFS transporter [Rhodococcus sp. MSC1_016]